LIAVALAMSSSAERKRIRFSNLLLLIAILVLGYALDVQHRKEERLRAALARYKSKSHGVVVDMMGVHFPLDWPDGTPLSTVIERIKQQTSKVPSPFVKGIPIYVDPDGLRGAGQSLGSPVKAPPSEDTPFRTKLKFVLEPLGLACQVKDAAIVITSRAKVGESLMDEQDEEESEQP
jgi:hypothetical protein